MSEYTEEGVMGRRIVKMAEKHREDRELRDEIRRGFSPMLGTPTCGRNSVSGYYEQGEVLATVYAEDFDGIRRSWAVTIYQSAGSMRSVWGHGRWTLMYSSNWTSAEMARGEEWLRSCEEDGRH